MNLQREVRWARRLLMGSVWLAVGTGCEAGGSLTVSSASVTIQATEGQQDPVGNPRLEGKVETSSRQIFLGAIHSQNGLEQVGQSLSNPFIIELVPKSPFSLGAGTYKDELVIVACEDEECEHPFEGSPFTVPVTYTIKPALFALSFDEKSFQHIIGSQVVYNLPVDVTTRSSRVTPWTASATQSWLRFSTSSGRTPQTVQVMADPEGLEPGRHTGEFVFTDTATGVTSQRIPITLDISLPTVRSYCLGHFPDCPGLSFGGPSGSSPQKLSFSLDTLSSTAAVYPWTASVDLGDGPSWLSLSSTSGTVAGNGWESVELTVSVNPEGLSAGTHTSTLTVNVTVEGHTVSRAFPISLTVAPQ